MASALDKLSTRERLILALVAVVVVGVGYLNFVYDPLTKKLKTIDNQIAQVQGEIGSFQQAISGLRRQNIQQKIQMARGEIVRIQDEMQFFQTRMSGQVQDVIGVLKRQAALHGIRLKSINSEESPAGGPNLQYRKVEISLKMESGYPGIGNFIQALEEVPAIIAVENLEVVREPKTLPRLKTSLTLRLFVI
ncbi:MAG: type 4a pilus biogenesis protein PilO [Candidatus Nitronauta litoralis]|uniref:Type 4a pilus biogenesis protein PilO n=1 Tax=Candidatus Nitronauta litoralis TaxID=2705533 RepID=A0A7T0BWZ0_9BACT|nr:MAG: type 4a pilus biogenesis protein PilO [Candidatus Nitronauta litoralis]